MDKHEVYEKATSTVSDIESIVDELQELSNKNIDTEQAVRITTAMNSLNDAILTLMSIQETI